MSDPTPQDAAVRMQQLFDQTASLSVPELFASYGIALRRVDADQEAEAAFLICGVIGFSGPSVRGALILALTENLPTLTNPLGPRGNLRDWVGELANQLLGRIKLALLAEGVDIYLNLPAVLKGEHIAPIPRHAIQPITFVAPEGIVGVWIEVEPLKGDAPRAPSQGGAKSGDAIVFE
jgi:CheY-specific phosphatase CheX